MHSLFLQPRLTRKWSDICYYRGRNYRRKGL